MDGVTTALTAQDIWQVKPATKNYSDVIKSISQSHRRTIPQSASSRSGLETLIDMYSIITQSKEGAAFFAPAVSGFASGTLSLRNSETTIKKKLPFLRTLKTAWYHLISPGHLISRFLWEKTIPTTNIGYILSIGLIPSEKTAQKIRGTHLLKALERFFVENGCSASWVDTELSNFKALDFYKRNGYVLVRSDWGHCLLKKDLVDSLTV